MLRKKLFYLAGSIFCVLLIGLEVYDLLTETERSLGRILHALFHILVWGVLAWHWNDEYQKLKKTNRPS